jgi:hypothetical protein
VQSEDLSADGEKILKWIVRKEVGRMLTGFIWLRIGFGDGFLQTL